LEHNSRNPEIAIWFRIVIKTVGGNQIQVGIEGLGIGVGSITDVVYQCGYG
jgi:hypothetical protein